MTTNALLDHVLIWWTSAEEAIALTGRLIELLAPYSHPLIQARRTCHMDGDPTPRVLVPDFFGNELQQYFTPANGNIARLASSGIRGSLRGRIGIVFDEQDLYGKRLVPMPGIITDGRLTWTRTLTSVAQTFLDETEREIVTIGREGIDQNPIFGHTLDPADFMIWWQDASETEATTGEMIRHLPMYVRDLCNRAPLPTGTVCTATLLDPLCGNVAPTLIVDDDGTELAGRAGIILHRDAMRHAHIDTPGLVTPLDLSTAMTIEQFLDAAQFRNNPFEKKGDRTRLKEEVPSENKEHDLARADVTVCAADLWTILERARRLKLDDGEARSLYRLSHALIRDTGL